MPPQRLKTAVVNTYSDGGGAALAARRLHQSLLSIGCESTFVVSAPSINFPATRAIPGNRHRWQSRFSPRLGSLKETFLLRSFKPTGTYWSSNLSSRASCRDLGSIDADIVNLHWIGDDFISIRDVAILNRPIVWSLHDQWAFTGGCHYAGECERFTSDCGDCPHLVRRKAASFYKGKDLSSYIQKLKKKSWQTLDITIVCASEWMASIARRSSLFRDRRIEIIRYPLNLKVFRPLDKSYARECFGLPQDRQLILFAAVGATSDPRKGFAELRRALPIVHKEFGGKAAAVVLGTWDAPEMGMPVYPVGVIRDETSLPLLYSACDLNVTPSRQDNYPNIIYETAACGIPTVAFSVGGIKDAIRNEETGTLVPPGDIEAFAKAIAQWLRRLHNDPALASSACLSFVQQTHDSEKQAKSYAKLFEEIVRRTCRG